MRESRLQSSPLPAVSVVFLNLMWGEDLTVMGSELRQFFLHGYAGERWRGCRNGTVQGWETGLGNVTGRGLKGGLDGVVIFFGYEKERACWGLGGLGS